MTRPPAPPADVVHEFRAMGSPCRIRVAGPGAAPAQRATTRQALAAAEAEVRRIEQRYSRYRDDSIVTQINATAGRRGWVALDEETAHLLDFAGQLHAASGGLFDLSAGVLRQVWDFRAARVPSAEQLAPVVACIGWQHVALDNGRIQLTRPGMELDLGGIGKEYAADRAASLLQATGLHHGYVNLGGDIRLLGPQACGAPWQLGVSHPRQPDTVITGVSLSQGAMATSGDYERYFEHLGQRYCHILNPHTGWPVQHWQSITVLAPACLAAGALCTIGMLLGPQAPEFLSAQGVAWIAIDAAGQLMQHDPHLAHAAATPRLDEP